MNFFENQAPGKRIHEGYMMERSSFVKDAANKQIDTHMIDLDIRLPPSELLLERQLLFQ